MNNSVKTEVAKIVSLFGTCNNSNWREEVMSRLAAANIEFFNPVVPDWKPEHAVNEAKHAAEDAVIMLVITGETTSIASMAESGWLAAHAIQRGQSLVMVLQDMPAETEPVDDTKRNNKARNLLRQHIKSLNSPNVFLCETIEAAADMAIQLMMGEHA